MGSAFAFHLHIFLPTIRLGSRQLKQLKTIIFYFLFLIFYFPRKSVSLQEKTQPKIYHRL